MSSIFEWGYSKWFIDGISNKEHARFMQKCLILIIHIFTIRYKNRQLDRHLSWEVNYIFLYDKLYNCGVNNTVMRNLPTDFP